jgi:hypothetical protein
MKISSPASYTLSTRYTSQNVTDAAANGGITASSRGLFFTTQPASAASVVPRYNVICADGSSCFFSMRPTSATVTVANQVFLPLSIIKLKDLGDPGSPPNTNAKMILLK